MPQAITATNGLRLNRFRPQITLLQAYDAGTEINDEVCASIPGGLSCGGGEGYNPEDGEGFVHPHPGLHGEG